MPLPKHWLLERMIFKFSTVKSGNFECTKAHIHQDRNVSTLLAIWFSFIINSIINHHQLHQFIINLFDGLKNGLEKEINNVKKTRKKIAIDLVSFVWLMTLWRSHNIKIFTKKEPVSIQILVKDFENLSDISDYVHEKLQNNSSLKNDKTNVFIVKLSPNFYRKEPRNLEFLQKKLEGA